MTPATRPGDSWPERMRSWLWPRAGWQRVALHAWKRIRRLKDTPHAIACGFTLGVAVSFTPLVGLHVVIACLLAWGARGNIIAALLGTLAGNPLTFPFIWALIYQVGARLSGEDAPARFDPRAVPEVEILLEEPQWSVTDVFATMMLGSVPVCLLLALAVYPVTRWSVGIYQHKRQQRKSAKRRAAMRARMEKP